MANILIIDDSEMVRSQLRADLETEGYKVFEAGNGIEGLAALDGANKYNIDLIFCDVNMPEMDGLTMCKEVHKDPVLSKIPIFMLTTQTSTTMKTEGKAAGVVAWIIKPYQKSSVLGALIKVLSKLAQ